MDRFYELMADVRKAFPSDDYARRWEAAVESDSSARTQFAEYDKAFSTLSERCWEILKVKALRHFNDHRVGQLKQGFFHQLNEAFAYQYLSKMQTSELRLLEEDGSVKPDIEFRQRGRLCHCEVKSIGVSDEEIRRFTSGDSFDTSCYFTLSDSFFAKLSSSLAAADKQIRAMSTGGMTFVVVRFDDFTSSYVPKYRNQLIEYLRVQHRSNVVIKAMRLPRIISAKSKVA